MAEVRKFTCDRCKAIDEIPTGDFRKLPAEWSHVTRVPQPITQSSGQSFTSQLCKICASELSQFMAGKAVPVLDITKPICSTQERD